MTYRGVVRGRTIEIEGRLPYPEGQVVSVSVQAAVQLGSGSPEALLTAMHAQPHLRPEDVDELERLIKDGESLPRRAG